MDPDYSLVHAKWSDTVFLSVQDFIEGGLYWDSQYSNLYYRLL
jgi:hypothetical protein